MAGVPDQIGKDNAPITPGLEQVSAPGWVAKGAPDAYAAQLQSCKDQVRAITIEAAALARNPEKISAGLQLLFRFQGLETMLLSLEDGARKYQTPQVAQSLAAAFAATGANRQPF